MTLIKSLLLGSAAGIVAVASAQAADLPTKKGAPAAEYVKIARSPSPVSRSSASRSPAPTPA